ncbi:MAG: DHHA1 domain-containing protein [Candidatus Diapherotrites archaeon]
MPSRAFVVKRFDEFAKSLSSRDRIVLLYDTDTDGVSAGVIVTKALGQICPKAKIFPMIQEHIHGELLEETLKKIEKLKPSKVIITDLAFDHAPKNLKKLSKLFPVLFIDHHPNYNGDLNSKNLAYVKSGALWKGEIAKYPASKMCYDLFSRHAELKKEKWIAAVGVIGDYSSRPWKKFIHKAAKESKSSLKELAKCARLSKATESISVSNVKPLYEFLLKAKSPKQLLRSRFGNFLKRVDKAEKKAVRGFEKNAQHFPEQHVHFYVLKGIINIKSVAASVISFSHFHETIFVFQPEDGKYSFSVRRQDGKIELNKLIEKVLPKLKGAKGGGHKYASAGIIRKQDLEKFEKLVVKELTSSPH